MAGSIFARARFMAGLILRVASRALPGKTTPDTDIAEDVIEEIMTGDTEALNGYGPGLAYGRDSSGTPWFFIALESGSLAAIDWFLAQGASPTAPDQSGRLPLEALIERAALADELDDHLSDCPAMAAALIAKGADPAARTLSGARLTDLAQEASLALPPAGA